MERVLPNRSYLYEYKKSVCENICYIKCLRLFDNYA